MRTLQERIEIVKGLKVFSDTLIRRLERYGYFTAPASTHYHSAYEGGLFDHSYQVAVELDRLTSELNLKWARAESPVIIGLLHDICKMYIYEKQEDGTYVHNTQYAHFPGHGEVSLIMSQKILADAGMKLTMEEMKCIRYHMGPYAGKDEWEWFDRAVKDYPNVLYTFMADMIASKIAEA